MERDAAIDVSSSEWTSIGVVAADGLIVRDAKVGDEENRLRQTRGFGPPINIRSRHPELQFVLAPMGRDLMRACGPKGGQLPE